MTMIESQINEIMKALGRIEQKTDTANESIALLQIGISKQEDRIFKIELSRATEKGVVKTIAALWSAIVAFITAITTIYLTNHK